MEREEQLAWEARAGKPAAAATFGYVLLAIASGVYLNVTLDDPPSTLTERFLSWEDEPGVYLVSVSVQALGVALLALAFTYLDRATAARIRRPPIARVLAIGAPLAVAVAGIVRQVEINRIAEGFAPGSEPKADRLLEEANPVVTGIAQASNLAFAFALITLSLGAMRAGLVSRFMGILGVVLGGLNLLTAAIAGGGSALGPVQLFWVGALGFLFLARWPGGRGPAWQSGEGIPWPRAAQQREEIVRRREQRDDGDDGQADPDSADVPATPAKKKRKRRR